MIILIAKATKVMPDNSILVDIELPDKNQPLNLKCFPFGNLTSVPKVGDTVQLVTNKTYQASFYMMESPHDVIQFTNRDSSVRITNEGKVEVISKGVDVTSNGVSMINIYETIDRLLKDASNIAGQVNNPLNVSYSSSQLTSKINKFKGN